MNQSYNFSSKSFKFVRVLPGLITLALLFSPIWATLIGIPQVVLYYVTFLSVYWFYKTVTSTIGNIVAFFRYRGAQKTNYDDLLKKLNWDELPSKESLPSSYDAFTQVIISPFYKEPYDLLCDTLDAVVKSTFDLKKVIFIWGVEESAGPQGVENAERTVAKYGHYFKEMKYYVHPRGIPGEAVGICGPNLRWAATQFVHELTEKGENLNNYLVTKFDSDLQVQANFLSNLAYTYLTTPDRYYAFYSPAVMLYSNNYWNVPSLMRVFSGALTLALMSEWITSKRSKQSFSCYSFSLKLLTDIDYWDPQIGVDDTGFFWRAYLALDGRFRGEEFYSATYSDAVETDSYVKTHVVQYKVLRRWGWGAIVYPMTIQGIFKNSKIPLVSKVQSLAELFRVYNMFTTISVLLMFALPVVGLINPDFGISSAAHVMPDVISYILTLSFIGLLPSRAILESLYGAPPKERGVIFFILHYFEQLLLVVFSLTLGFFPYIQAQLEMMIGKSMTFIVTPKLRKE